MGCEVSTHVLDANTLIPQSVGSDDDLIHQVCCDDDIALCGAFIPGDDWCDDEPLTCPICAWIDDEYLPCTIAGCEYAS